MVRLVVVGIMHVSCSGRLCMRKYGNRREANQHEIVWRLLDTTLFVTIEPCVMCSGAIGLAHSPYLSTGSKSEVWSNWQPLWYSDGWNRLNHRVEWRQSVLQERVRSNLCKDFRNRRQSKSYDILFMGSSFCVKRVREESAALNDVSCVLFFLCTLVNKVKDLDELGTLFGPRATRELRSKWMNQTCRRRWILRTMDGSGTGLFVRSPTKGWLGFFF